MPLPKQLREQNDAINDWYENRNNPDADSNTGNGDSRADAAASDQHREPARDERSREQPAEGQQPTDQSGNDRSNDPAYWRHRAEVMQGMVRRNSDELNAARQQNTELQRRIEKIESQRSQAPANANGDGGDSRPVQSMQEMYEQHGPEFVDSVLDVLKRQGFVRQEDMDREFQRQREQEQQQSQQREQQQRMQGFQQQLLERVPDLFEVNNDPMFRHWLGESDLPGGETRQQRLTRAEQNADAEAVAQIFEGFKAFDRGETPVRDTAPDTTRAPSRERPQSGHQYPADAIQPRQTRATQAPREQKIWSRADINEFYKDQQQGRYRGREDEARRLEQDIIDANHEGRIRG